MSEIAKCERCKEYNAAAVDFRHQATSAQNDYPAILARHNALREAVAWERECTAFAWSQCMTAKNQHVWVRRSLEFTDSLEAARAEVDRLLGEK